MNEPWFTKINPAESDFCQPTTMLEISDPCLLSDNGRSILYGTLRQKDAAKASYGTDIGFFCYVGKDLTRWAGPFLLCDNPTDAKILSSPKPIQVGDSVYLIGKYETEGKNGLIVYQSDHLLGKFRFVSSFCLSVDCVPDADENGKLYLYSVENGEVTLREFSDDLLHLSAPTKLTKKLNATAAPCLIKDSDRNTVGLVVPTEKGLMLLSKPKKESSKPWKVSKLKWKLPADSVSSYRDDSGRNLLVIGLHHSFALIPYTSKKGKLTLGDAILPYREEEIQAVQQAQADLEKETDTEPSQKSKKEIHLPINLSTLAAITIALVSAGIGIMMGLTTGKEKKEKPVKVKKEKKSK